MDEHAIREYLKTIGNGGGASQETDPVFTASPAYGISAQDIADWNDKQEELVSGTNIKTINGTSVLGSGDITIVDMFYPVGSYYETSDTTFDPNVRWGGTWVRETAGLVHVSASIGAGTDYEVIGAPSDTQDGGEKTHELTAGETGIRNHVHAMGAHTHNSVSGYYLLFLSTSGNKAVNRRSIKPGTGTAISNIYYGENAIERGSVIGGMTSATNTGNPTVGEQSGSAHNNMQPYINVVRWHRTA